MQSSGSELKLDVHARARNGASSRAKEKGMEKAMMHTDAVGKGKEKEKHVRNSEARREKGEGEGSRCAKQDEEASNKKRRKRAA